jgi:nicotinate-nucleotide adenylyltransferase
VATQRIGILGGTFDPIHYGHLAIAEEARWFLDLVRVYLVPAAQQPLKRAGHTATPQQRLEMVQLACASNPAFTPSDIELQRSPPSFTVDTLTEFLTRFGPETELWFILGGDALVDLPRWHNASQIVNLTRLAVAMRPGTSVDLAALDAILPGLAERVVLIDGPHLNISSSALRERIAAGQPVRYQLPDSVLDYIIDQQLYRTSGSLEA